MMTHIDENGEIIAGPFLRTPYNYDMNKASNETALHCEDATRAQQQFKDETDINVIVERFGLTGEIPKDVRTPTNEEFWEIQNFQGALNQINAAREAFMQMPAKIRAEFDNDAGKFIDFVSDEDNRTRAEKLGIITKKEPIPETPPTRVVVVDTTKDDTKK